MWRNFITKWGNYYRVRQYTMRYVALISLHYALVRKWQIMHKKYPVNIIPSLNLFFSQCTFPLPPENIRKP